MGSKRKRKAASMPIAVPAAKRQQKTSKKTALTPATAPLPPPIDTFPLLANPQGADRQREVDLYTAIGSEDGVERLGAANAIVIGLLGGDGVEESTMQRHVEKLTRGLATGRQGSRLGRSVVLTELLSTLFGMKDLAARKYPNLTFDQVLGILVAKTKPEGDLSGQEGKDHYLGLLFGLECFVRAKILFGDDGRWRPVLDKLVGLAEKKPWIREQCGYVVVEALAQMDKYHAEYTLQELYEAGLAASPEGVGIWLTARTRFPNMRFPSKPWGQDGNPLNHLTTLAKTLRESSSTTRADEHQAVQTGSWNPKLHFVWNIVLAQYATADSMDSNFGTFWKVAVDENLFSSSASPERKFWGFSLFQKLFREHSTYKALLSSIFSRNLVLCLINQLQSAERLLNGQAKMSLDILVQAAEADSSIAVAVLPHLIGGYSNYNFDTTTKTKTIEKLLGFVEDNTASSVVKLLLKPTLRVEGSNATKQADMRRHVFSDYMLSIIRRINVHDESRDFGWVRDTALPTIANIAYCDDARFQPEISAKIRGLSRDRLMSCFAHLLSDLKGYSFLCDLVKDLQPSAIKMDAKIAETRDTALSAMTKILKKAKKADPRDMPPLQALALLYAMTILQLYNGEPEAVSTLDELQLFYDKLVRQKDHGDTEIEASEVLVELLLSFISKPSALLRKVTQHVFRAFIAHITVEGLKLITDVLESKENLRGQQEMFVQEHEGEEDSGDDSDMELDSDVEIGDMNGEEGRLTTRLDDEESSEDNDYSDGQDSSDEHEDEGVKELNDALAQALGTHSLDQDAANESDSDADMTDSEMMALDSKLVEIFSQRKKIARPKQEQKGAKETIVNFKSRALDLLVIFVKSQPGNALTFGILLPLLKLIRKTRAKNLAERALSIVQLFQKTAKKHRKTAAEADVAKQINLMKAIHLEAPKYPSNTFARAVSTSSLIIAASCYRADEGSFREMKEIYADSKVASLEGGVKIPPVLFRDWVNWCQNHGLSD